MLRRVTRLAAGVISGSLIFVGAIWLLTILLEDSDRIYQGATIAEWSERLNIHSPGGTEYRKAVAEGVVPILRNEMFHDTNDSRLKVVLVEKLNLLPGVYIRAAEAYERRAMAAENLGRLGEAAGGAVNDLVRCLKGTDGFARPAAAEAIGNIRTDPRTTIPVLIEALSDGDDDVVVNAAEALGKYGKEAEAAIPKLMPLLKARSKEIPPAARNAIMLIDPSMEVPQIVRM